MTMRQALRQELEKITQPLAIAVSDGVDSKALAICAVEDLGYRPIIVSMTLSDRQSTDFRGAERFASAYGLEFVPVLLPVDAKIIERDIVTLVRTHKVFGKASIECNWGFLYVCEALQKREIDHLVTGLGCLHFQEGRNPGIQGVRENAALFQKFRHRDFSKPNSSGMRDLRRIAASYGITAHYPWKSPALFNLWLNKTWADLNKPLPKNPIRVEFPALRNNARHSNLQLGDSGIRDLLAATAIRRWKPQAKSSKAAYNVVAGRAQ